MADDQVNGNQDGALPQMKPILILGLGGTGLDAIYRVRRRVLDRYGSLDRMPIVSFLWLDCDPGWEGTARNHPDVALPEEHRLQPAEMVDLSVTGATDLYDGIARGNFPHLEWFSLAHLRHFADITAGAGNVRQLGRLCLFQNIQKVRTAITSQLDKINSQGARGYVLDNCQQPTAAGLDIYLVCSLAGGTGSGIFLDVAYLCRELANQQQDWSVIGFLLLASAFPGGNSQRKNANCYAALRECNYYSQGSTGGTLAPLFADARFDVDYGGDKSSNVSFAGTPFTMSYVLNVTNTESVQQDHDWLLNMLADYICLDFSTFGPFKRSKRQDIHRATATRHDAAGMPANFQSCGACALYFPAPQASDALAARLARDVAATWFCRSASQVLLEDGEGMRTEWLPGVVSGTRAHVSDSFAPSHGLFQKQDDSGGVIEAVGLGHGGEPIVNGPGHWAQKVQARVIEESWPTNRGWIDRLEQVRQTEDAAYSTSGKPVQWGAYTRQMVTNADKLGRKLAQDLRREIATQVADPARGPDWAWCFLEQLKFAMEKWAADLERHARDASFIAEQLGDVFLINETRRQGAGIPISSIIEDERNKCLNRLDNLARRPVVLQKRRRMLADTEKYLRWASMYQRARVLEVSRSQGARVLRDLCGVCGELVVTLGQVRYALGRAQERATHKAEAARDRVVTMPVAGDRLVNEALLDQLYADHVRCAPEAAPARITQDILKALGMTWLDLADRLESDPTLLDKLAKKLWSRCRAAVPEFGIPDSERKTTSTGAVDILCATYPGDADLRNHIESAWRQSMPYAEHAAALSDGKWSPASLLMHGLAGVFGGHLADDPDPERRRVLDVLENLGLKPGDVSDNGNPATINFAHEIGGLPLRALAGVPEWRDDYLALLGSPDSPPLHTVRDDLATRFPDIFPPDQAVVAQAHFAVEVANCLGLFTEARIKEPGAVIVVHLLCFSYVHGTGLAQVEQLARDLPSCKVVLTENSRSLSRLLETIDKHVAEADDARRAEIQQCLKGLLDRALQAAGSNTAQPAYQMLFEQVNDLAARHNLSLA